MRSPWDVLVDLYDNEINAGLESDWDGGIRVWIGNSHTGRRWVEVFPRHEFDQIAGWLERHAELPAP